MGDRSHIQFGIDDENPYYIEDNENSPEVSNKFTGWQFNQFAYILCNPSLDFNNKNNISNIVYPSKEFDLIVEGYTKIIMEVLNCANNNYNYTLTK